MITHVLPVPILNRKSLIRCKQWHETDVLGILLLYSSSIFFLRSVGYSIVPNFKQFGCPHGGRMKPSKDKAVASFVSDKTEKEPGYHEHLLAEKNGVSPPTPADVELLEDDRVSRWIALITLTVLSFLTRLYRIDQPEWVCWDEVGRQSINQRTWCVFLFILSGTVNQSINQSMVGGCFIVTIFLFVSQVHFGKMASWYINRTFFFDVHPPLGKMSISLIGYLTGYNGTFAWDKPGDPFFDHSYVGMRIYCAILGALLVPLIFETVYNLSGSVRAATLAGACVLFDTGLITLTRWVFVPWGSIDWLIDCSVDCLSAWLKTDLQ